MRLYHDALYDWSQPVESLWETDRPSLPAPAVPGLETDETADVAIIGGGYCGLSAAYHLARAGIDVRVLEAGAIGWGSSGRNGGFCSIGASFLGPAELNAIYGSDETLAFYRSLIDAVRLVGELAQEERIDLRKQGNGVWTFAHKPNRFMELQAQADLMTKLGVGAKVVSASEFENRAFACTEQLGALFEPVGFGLHPLSYCLGLADAATRRGAHLHAHSRVLSWHRENGAHRLVTSQGSLRAKRVIVAANGWLPEDLVPELYGRSLPVMSNIVSTRPLSNAELANQSWRTQSPASNTRAHLAYLRMLPGNHLMYGGRGDTTGSPSGLVAMSSLLTKRLARMFPAFAGAEITHSWRGLISATRRMTPAIGELESDPSVSYAFGCHGNGVAFMTWAGRELANRITGISRDLPAPLRGLPPKFPIPALRLWALRLMLLRARIGDEL
ncbi:MAG: FAD-dependent oxidoreductase [Alphaproteobacteria bacterium]|nr:FAD-dependent oxidoreductase [Alphaproteobacteria bacterium]